jgi:hypothetical protein
VCARARVTTRPCYKAGFFGAPFYYVRRHILRRFKSSYIICNLQNMNVNYYSLTLCLRLHKKYSFAELNSVYQINQCIITCYGVKVQAGKRLTLSIKWLFSQWSMYKDYVFSDMTPYSEYWLVAEVTDMDDI